MDLLLAGFNLKEIELELEGIWEGGDLPTWTITLWRSSRSRCLLHHPLRRHLREDRHEDRHLWDPTARDSHQGQRHCLCQRHHVLQGEAALTIAMEHHDDNAGEDNSSDDDISRLRTPPVPWQTWTTTVGLRDCWLPPHSGFLFVLRLKIVSLLLNIDAFNILPSGMFSAQRTSATFSLSASRSPTSCTNCFSRRRNHGESRLREWRWEDHRYHQNLRGW